MNSHNGELLGAYGNFVNRCLTFIGKYFDGCVPEGRENEERNGRIESLFVSVGKQIENGAFKDAIDEIFEFGRNNPSRRGCGFPRRRYYSAGLTKR